MLAKRREHELTFFAVGHRLAGLRVDDLPQEVVFGDVLHVAAREALARNARAHDLGQAIVVGAHDVHAALDFSLQGRRARLAAEQADAQGALLPIDAHLLAHFAHVHGVAWRGNENRRTVILNHLNLALGIARTRRNHHAAKALQAIMQAKTAGEHAIAKCHLHAVARHDTRHLHQAHNAVGPQIHVAAVVANDDRLARSARRSMQFDDIVERFGEQAIRERFAKGVLIGEGKLAHIGQRLNVGRLHAHRIHFVAIPRNAVIRPINLVNKASELNSLNALTARTLDGRVVDRQLIKAPLGRRLQRSALHGHVCHGTTCLPGHCCDRGRRAR